MTNGKNANAEADDWPEKKTIHHSTGNSCAEIKVYSFRINEYIQYINTKI